jgi:hypothetical protein
MKIIITILCVCFLLLTSGISGAEPIASVVAVRGKATVDRVGKHLEAQPRLGIELQDMVTTQEGGRVKLLFIDDSVLTLAEKSRMSVDTFVHSRSDQGKSLFNLLDGKMRAVVGRTRFEVKTPTVVAAARGTVILFDVGTLNGQQFTRVTCLEGIVDIRLLTAPPGTPPVMISPGQSILVMSGQPLPQPTQLSPAELEKLKKNTGTSGAEIKLPDTAPRETIIRDFGFRPIPPPPRPPLVPVRPTKVDIGVTF